MPRVALRILLVLVVTLGSPALLAIDPHMDASRVPGMCSACHKGHGVARSPMLPAPQVDVCLSCHGSQANRDRMSQKGYVHSRLSEPTPERGGRRKRLYGLLPTAFDALNRVRDLNRAVWKNVPELSKEEN